MSLLWHDNDGATTETLLNKKSACLDDTNCVSGVKAFVIHIPRSTKSYFISQYLQKDFFESKIGLLMKGKINQKFRIKSIFPATEK